MADSWLGKVRGHVGEAKDRFSSDKRQREEAGAAPKDKNIILTKNEVQGEWDASRVLMTTIGGKARPITADDLATFRHNMRLAQTRFKGGKGITARQVIDMASSQPLSYASANPSEASSDIDKARKEITSGIPVSAHNGMVRFITNAGKDSDVTRHHVVVMFNAFDEAGHKLAATEAKDRKSPKQVANWLRKQKLSFDCDCGRHRYFLRYVATIGGFAAGRQEWGFPKIRNPGLKGVACKHVLRVMTEIESSNTVLRFLEKYMEKLQASADNTARIQAAQSEAEEAASSKSATKIKTSEQRKAEAMRAKERRAAKSAVKAAPRSKAKKPAATRRLEAQIDKGEITAEDLIAQLRRLGKAPEEIMAALKGQ
jgi:hypothetical protein